MILKYLLDNVELIVILNAFEQPTDKDIAVEICSKDHYVTITIVTNNNK